MQLLLLLASKAGFVGLSDRDVQLGISLNTDYLWQLFVKVRTRLYIVRDVDRLHSVLLPGAVVWT
jgi:hypothetical protein